MSDLAGFAHSQVAKICLANGIAGGIHAQLIQVQAEQERDSKRFASKLATHTNPLPLLVGCLDYRAHQPQLRSSSEANPAGGLAAQKRGGRIEGGCADPVIAMGVGEQDGVNRAIK